MRFRAIAVGILALAAIGHAQTAGELKAKFGHFDGKSYRVAHDVRLTVAYGDDHYACRLQLRSSKTGGRHGIPLQPNFEAEVADHVLNEIAPSALRKGTPRTNIAQMSCSVVTTTTYDNVGIGRVTTECGDIGKNNVQSLEIDWIRPACK
jgi:hypothetical protein